MQTKIMSDTPQTFLERKVCVISKIVDHLFYTKTMMKDVQEKMSCVYQDAIAGVVIFTDNELVINLLEQFINECDELLDLLNDIQQHEIYEKRVLLKMLDHFLLKSRCEYKHTIDSTGLKGKEDQLSIDERIIIDTTDLIYLGFYGKVFMGLVGNLSVLKSYVGNDHVLDRNGYSVNETFKHASEVVKILIREKDVLMLKLNEIRKEIAQKYQ